MIKYDKSILINVGEKIFYIPLNELYIKQEQFYVLKKHGLTKSINDIHNIKDKSDIIVKIKMT